MYGKLFLLVVVLCATSVYGNWYPEDPDTGRWSGPPTTKTVTSNYFMDILKGGFPTKGTAFDYTPGEELEDVIQDGLIVAEDIFELGVKLSKKEWSVSNEIGQIISGNSTEYTRIANNDKDRIQKAISTAAENARNEFRRLGSLKGAEQCIENAKEKGLQDIELPLKTFVAEIWHLNFEFNSTYPEFPFLLIEKVLLSEYLEKVESIKSRTDKTSVGSKIEAYVEAMSERYNSMLKTTTAVSSFFFRHQLQLGKKYRETNRKMEKIYLTTFGDLRKCLDAKEVSRSSYSNYLI